MSTPVSTYVRIRLPLTIGLVTVIRINVEKKIDPVYLQDYLDEGWTLLEEEEGDEEEDEEDGG